MNGYMSIAIAVVLILLIAGHYCPQTQIAPPARRARRQPARRIRRTRRQQPRPAAPPALPPDRAALIDCLRQLGHRAADARRLAATVPADITNIDDCIEFVYRKA